MFRLALIAAIAGAMFVALPAHAQANYPQDGDLDGAPPPLQVPQAPKPAAPTAPKATAPKPAAPRATTPAPIDTSQKTEQARLARVAADLEAQKVRLDAREADLKQEEARLARERADQDADYAHRLAELDRKPASRAPVTASLPPEADQPYGAARIRVSYDEATRACTRAGMSDAMDNNFYSARYETAPRFFERQRELRGRMRMVDREGYLTVDTVCQLDANGVVLRFDVLR